MVNWKFQLEEALLISACLEAFFYGLYSGIFVMYLHCSSNKSKMATILFYALCLLYVLSTATVVIDLLVLTIPLYIYTVTRSLQIQIDSLPTLIHLSIVQSVASGGCDFIAQCTMIYRCWIVWGQNIRVVIIPSFLAIAYLATWMATNGATTFVQGNIFTAATAWEDAPGILTSITLSMVVNALVTGLIVFKILKVFLEVKASMTTLERTLGSTGGTKLRHVIFIIIESGMAFFAIQLVSIVLFILRVQDMLSHNSQIGLYLFIGIHRMFNGITPTIILVRVSTRLSFEDQESFKEAIGSFCFNNPPSNSDQNKYRMGSSSMPHQDQERSEDT